MPGFIRLRRSPRKRRWNGPKHIRAKVPPRHRAGDRPASRVAFAGTFLFVTVVLLGLRALADRVPGRAEAGVEEPIAPPASGPAAHTTGPSRIPWSRAASRTP
ncbi:hypothetical protein [Dactylosporangium sp. CA-139066]|uniref:hypothetical protein n=1 Tax=Dactylosporangium sp. CA-139066 TaxID=3239930 RepID=UPI003D8C57E9